MRAKTYAARWNRIGRSRRLGSRKAEPIIAAKRPFPANHTARLPPSYLDLSTELDGAVRRSAKEPASSGESSDRSSAGGLPELRLRQLWWQGLHEGNGDLNPVPQ